jgi:hypothetical protein
MKTFFESIELEADPVEQALEEYFQGFGQMALQDVADLVESLTDEEISQVENVFDQNGQELTESWFSCHVRPYTLAYLSEADLTKLAEAAPNINVLRMAKATNKNKVASLKKKAGTQALAPKTPAAPKVAPGSAAGKSFKKRIPANIGPKVKPVTALATRPKNTGLATTVPKTTSMAVKASTSLAHTTPPAAKEEPPKTAIPTADTTVTPPPAVSAQTKARGSNAGKAISGALHAIKTKAGEAYNKAKQAAPGVLKTVGKVAGRLAKGAAKLAWKGAKATGAAAGRVATRAGAVAKHNIRMNHPNFAHIAFGHEDEHEAGARKSVDAAKAVIQNRDINKLKTKALKHLSKNMR